MKNLFFCIDGHTAGNPVRLVVGGGPMLRSQSISDKRLEFMAEYDWIRTGLCFEPRGHAMMSGGFIFPPTREDTDFGILFMETSGCLPMCGHGTIGMTTFALESGLVRPKTPGRLKVEVPAGLIDLTYQEKDGLVEWVEIRNIPSFLEAEGLEVDVEGLGKLRIDVAYGGNYYAIVEPQGEYTGLDQFGVDRLISLSRKVRKAVQEVLQPVHPLEPSIRGVSHVLWTDKPKSPQSTARNAVFYGDAAIDRSPCGTGTSARMAQLAAKGRLKIGEEFTHESYIGSTFIGKLQSEVQLGDKSAVIPLIRGSARATGYNTIWLDEKDLFAKGFLVI